MNYILCVINYFLVADVYLIRAAFLFFSTRLTRWLKWSSSLSVYIVRDDDEHMNVHRTLDSGRIEAHTHDQKKEDTLARLERRNETLIQTYLRADENKPKKSFQRYESMNGGSCNCVEWVSLNMTINTE